MRSKRISRKQELIALCAAVLEVFEQWWEVRRVEAASLIARNTRTFQVRTRKDIQMPDVYYWLWSMNATDEYEPCPHCVDWYFARTLPRYFRICTERLRQMYDADIRHRMAHHEGDEFLKLRIERMLEFSLYADHLGRALIATEEEPRAVAKIRERVKVVKIALD